MGEYFDAVEWVGLDEEEAKKLIEKYNKEGKDAGLNQQSTTKRPRLDKTESNKDTRDSRNRDNRDRRNNCELLLLLFTIIYYIILYCMLAGKIKIEVAILGAAALIWEEVGEERDRKGVVT